MSPHYQFALKQPDQDKYNHDSRGVTAVPHRILWLWLHEVSDNIITKLFVIFFQQWKNNSYKLFKDLYVLINYFVHWEHRYVYILEEYFRKKIIHSLKVTNKFNMFNTINKYWCLLKIWWMYKYSFKDIFSGIVWWELYENKRKISKKNKISL